MVFAPRGTAKKKDSEPRVGLDAAFDSYEHHTVEARTEWSGAAAQVRGRVLRFCRGSRCLHGPAGGMFAVSTIRTPGNAFHSTFSINYIPSFLLFSDRSLAVSCTSTSCTTNVIVVMGAGIPILASLVVAVGVLYQFALQPVLYHRLGVGRPVELINNQNCELIKELQSCEGA